MVEFSAVIGPLSGVLGASIVVERLIAFAKNVLEPLVGVTGARKGPKLSDVDKKIDELQYRYELNQASLAIEHDPRERVKRTQQIEAQLLTESVPANKKDLENRRADLSALGEWEERFPLSKILVQPATDPDDGATLRAVIIQLLGFAAGILLANISGLRLFHLLLNGSVDLVPWVDHVLTGLLIGGGSTPVHLLIQFITERRVPPDAQSAIAEESPQLQPAERSPAVPAIITKPAVRSNDEWIDIHYAGGVDRDILEDVHRRKQDPDMIVYHHTAMSSRSTFQDVVNVIKNRSDSTGKKWLTGYNCVILADGSVHAFCRWDRYGSHAAGYNMRSLGLTFNGNFETDAKVPFSNPSGRYGPTKPTEEQLKAGAKVITLWSYLYPIALDFSKHIIPHKQISDKTCPGNMFPYEDLQRWVELYRQLWDKSANVKEQIDAYKRKPYLYVKGGRP